MAAKVFISYRRDEEGNRRLDNPKDFLRIEIATVSSNIGITGISRCSPAASRKRAQIRSVPRAGSLTPKLN
jgi:hypothetical protein